MCGIVGIVKLDPRDGVDEARLRRMRDSLRHRGPDDAGLFLEGPVGLGHRRLSIVDPAGGGQPMAGEDGGLRIVYNGEIYTHASLRPGLEARGHTYRTRSDTETILHLYEEEGERCVERLRGMFAFALWDRAAGRLLLARDRLGIKPLYYALTGDELIFASEIKAILEAGRLRPSFNEAILPEYLATRFVSGEETFFRGVRKLLPGRTLTWSLERGFGGRRYWSLPEPRESSGGRLQDEAVRVRNRLEEAVKIHLMSDVPLGLFLSGWNERLGAAYGALVPQMLRDAAGRLITALPPPARRYASRTFLAFGSGPRESFFENFAVFPEARLKRLLLDRGPLDARDPYAVGLRCYEESAGAPLQKMSHADLQTYLVELLMKQDQMSMAASIESRVPYLDHEFVEHIAALPPDLKIRGLRTKAILREAVRGLVPREILTRRKMGFPVPVGRWFRGPFAPLVRDLVLGPRALRRGLFDRSGVERLYAEHRSGSARHADRLWLLINLEIWQRIFIDGEDPGDLMSAAREPAARIVSPGLAMVAGGGRSTRLDPAA